MSPAVWLFIYQYFYFVLRWPRELSANQRNELWIVMFLMETCILQPFVMFKVIEAGFLLVPLENKLKCVLFFFVFFDILIGEFFMVLFELVWFIIRMQRLG